MGVREYGGAYGCVYVVESALEQRLWGGGGDWSGEQRKGQRGGLGSGFIGLERHGKRKGVGAQAD